MSEAARALADIRTTPVTRDRPVVEVRLAGVVVPDETRTAVLISRVAGRLDRLYVESAGEMVRRGDPVAEIYSPELLTAARELRQTTTAGPAREKLRRLGLDAGQIDALAAGPDIPEHVTLRAEHGGIVVQREVQEGATVTAGAVIARVADLSTVWTRLDAYESDLPWIREGQDVRFTVPALPGERFRGQVSFVSPSLDPVTRTAEVRVVVPNPDDRLKPQMLVEGIVFSEPDGPEPLVIPRSAVLLTGKRAVVYVRDPSTEAPTFEGREVVLGPRAGEQYVVEEGLEEGESVVTNGAFKIDSALQIQGKPSLLSHRPDDAEAGLAPDDPALARALTPLYESYREVTRALAADDAPAARRAIGTLKTLVGGDLDVQPGPRDRKDWEAASRRLTDELAAWSTDADLDAMRVAFEPVSATMIGVVERFGHALDTPMYQIHCPMAFDDRGADWLQSDPEVRNPYFGAAMLRCGDVVTPVRPLAELEGTP
jgi:Cu(I)/Ag(I) efflux system membrane fusion protein